MAGHPHNIVFQQDCGTVYRVFHGGSFPGSMITVEPSPNDPQGEIFSERHLCIAMACEIERLRNGIEQRELQISRIAQDEQARRKLEAKCERFEGALREIESTLCIFSGGTGRMQVTMSLIESTATKALEESGDE